MLESELQAHIEHLVDDDSLLDAISAKERADSSMYSHENEAFLPTFPIDFLMRRNALFAAQHVLDRLHVLQPVSTSTSSISLDRSERLFPDLLLCNPERSVLILMELKRSGQTARETITELLAYEHEVRNHLPFLSNLDICHVIVSTEYTPLLDHSIAGLVTWESKQILCLEVSETAGDFALQVHIPSSWTSIGQRPLPADSISTAVLCLYEEDENQGNDERNLLLTANTAVDLIAREADRANSHGFIMLWEDSWYGGMSQTRFNLTIGVVNPYSFVPAAVEAGFLSPSQSPLTDFVMTDERYLELCPDDSVHGRVCEKAIQILKEHCNPMWERFCSWDRDRSPIRTEDAVMLGLNHRAIPLRFEFWGALGDFARQYVTMPAIRKTLDPAIRKYSLDWRHPSVAIELLDRLTGMDLVRGGRFDCKTMFEIGLATGAFLSIAGTAADTENDDLKNLPASFAWYGATFGCAAKEIALRWMSTPDMPTKPPTVRFACEKGSPTVDDVQSLIKWICNHFCEDSGVHKTCFQVGLQAVYVLDPYFATSIGEEGRQSVVPTLVEFGRAVVGRAVDEANDEGVAEDIRDNLRQVLKRDFPQIVVRGRLQQDGIDEIPEEDLIAGLSGPLFELLDHMCLPLVHSIAGLAPMDIDWQWIRDQVRELRSRGIRNAGVVVAADGTFGAGDLGEEASIITYDADEQVLVLYEVAGNIPMIMAYSWQDLENGKLFTSAQ